MTYDPNLFEGLMCGRRDSTSRLEVDDLLWCDNVFYKLDEMPGSIGADVFLSQRGNWYQDFSLREFDL